MNRFLCRTYHSESPRLTMMSWHARVNVKECQIDISLDSDDISSVEWNSVTEVSCMLIVHCNLITMKGLNENQP